MKTFYHLKDFFKKHKWSYILGIILLILADVLQLIMPKILGSITDALVDNSLNTNKLYFLIFLLILGAAIVSLCRYGWRMCIMGNARKLEYFLRNKFFAHLETLSQDFFNSHKTGDLMACATNDIQAVRISFGNGIVMAIDSTFFTVLTFITMITTIDIKLTMVALLPLPIITILILTFGKQVHKRFKIVQEYFGKLTNNVQENISGIRVIKSFVQEEGSSNKFRELNKKNVNKNMNLIKLYGFTQPMIMFIASLSFIIALFYGGNMVINDDISLGQLVSFVTYLGLLTWPMMAIGFVVNVIQRGTASMDRLNEILNTKPEIKDSEDTYDMDSLDGTISFKNLTFTYKNTKTPVLKNITFNVEKGKTLAIIGKTGSGKSTLANLLLRLYNAPRGTIFIDGVDINYIPLKTLRENIGYVPQDNFLFSRSIEKNIGFYEDNVPLDKIQKFAEISQIHREIMEFPDKYNTFLGERGVNLSGGQKQRVSISRALIKEPKILILDDCLSAVDAKTEEKILNFLKKETSKRTSLIISHRISSIKDADEIIVLDDGLIIQKGTHNELINEEGLYKELYTMQEISHKIENQY